MLITPSRMPIVGIAALLLIGWEPTHASTFRTVARMCPIDGEPFAATEVLSGTSEGRYLDLAHFGAVIDPRPLPTCPRDGFVVFKQQFTAEEQDRLRAIVASKEYQSLREIESDYYIAAWLRRAMGEPVAAVRHMLLQATWQVTEDAFSRAPADPRYQRYAAEALTAFEAALAIEDADHDQRITDQFVAGELRRRLGQFGEARERFELLLKDPAVAETEWLPAVQFELQLIDSQDSKRHAFPAAEPGRSPEEKNARSAAFSRCMSANDPGKASECATRLGDCVRGHDGATPESAAALISCLNGDQL